MKLSKNTGKFAKKDDFDAGPKLLHILKVEMADVSVDPNEREIKAVVHFMEEDAKPLVLNATNQGRLIDWYGDETDDWYKKPIVLFNDMEVTFGNTRGGIRVRLPKQAQQPAQPEPEVLGANGDNFEDDIPF